MTDTQQTTTEPDELNGEVDPGVKFTQADVEAIIAKRLEREGIFELRKKAKRLDDLEQQKLTDEEKTQERITKLEQQIQSSATEALRMRIANRYGVSEEDAELFLTATDADGIEKQAKRLAEKTADDDKAAKRGRNHVPAEGKQSITPTENEERRAVRQIFKGDE